MEDHKQIEQYLKDHRWGKAYEWVETKVRIYQNKVARRLFAANVFGLLVSVIVAFFTWVVLYPSADKKELEAFPFTTLCHDLFVTLCEKVPCGKPAVIGGLIVLPFLVCGVLTLISLAFRPKPCTARDKTVRTTPKAVKERLELMMKLHGKCDEGYMKALFLYFLLAVVLTGVTMTISAAPGGLNPFEYLIVGAICALVQAGVFFVCAWVFSWFCSNKERFYGVSDWHKELDRVIDKDKPKNEPYIRVSDRVKETEFYKEKFDEYYAMYTGTEYETPEQKAARIVRETEEDLSGKGYGDY